MQARFSRDVSLLCAALLLAACGGGGGYTTPSTSPPASPPASGGPTATITIPSSDGYGTSSFAPGNLTVAPGTTVTWSNRDSVAHSTASSNGNLWSATIEAGGSYAYTFAARGSYNYRCTIHSGMSGTVTVE